MSCAYPCPTRFWNEWHGRKHRKRQERKAWRLPGKCCLQFGTRFREPKSARPKDATTWRSMCWRLWERRRPLPYKIPFCGESVVHPSTRYKKRLDTETKSKHYNRKGAKVDGHF